MDTRGEFPSRWGSALLTDLYQLTMLQAYVDEGLSATATFELSVRALPPRWGFLVAAGLEPALAYLEDLHFDESELEWLAASSLLQRGCLDRLASLRFTGAVAAVPEGTVVFPGEPLLRVTAPLPEAQLAESRLLNLIHYSTLVASKAARMVLAARGRSLVDFGLRRAHGAEAALLAARSSWVAGFSGTATVEAGRRYDLPLVGTMAHSYVQAHASEEAAFLAFARSSAPSVTLLLDTYDTLAAAREVVSLASRLRREGGPRIDGVRLDSGNLAELATGVRRILDEGGLDSVRILASGGLDEDAIAQLVAAAAPIDGFGVGTRLATVADAPSLDAVYKLVSYEGRPRHKRSPGKASLPGVKQVLRRCDANGVLLGDTLVLEEEAAAASEADRATPLLQPVMAGGRRLRPAEGLQAARERCRASLGCLPPDLRRLDAGPPPRLELSPRLRRLVAAAATA